MKYVSTRDVKTEKSRVSAAEAIKNGLAPDGGLYMPEEIPALDMAKIESLAALSYPERAAEILSMYLDDYTKEELLEDCRAAYSEEKFPGGAAPVVPLDGTVNTLELWHGPTCAFKDMALQIMPRLLSRALVKTGEQRTAHILVATSGDTGKAALEGYRDIDRIKITVFYPCDGVSKIQKLQMATQEGDNVFVSSIRGNFDDAQNGVKRIFADASAAEELDKNGFFLSSANSINWGRLAPQIVYYISAYCDLLSAGTIRPGDAINICVPTGNFGNIFAAYLAYRMGLPVHRLICASNTNNILTDFITTGTYDRNRTFHKTMSPSMDILISSNLERLLYVIAGPEKTAGWMKSLAETGAYSVDAETLTAVRTMFSGYFSDEEQTRETIRATFDTHGYLIDTHTAVGLGCARSYISESGDKTPLVLASTASAFKFASDVLTALGGDAFEGAEAMEQLSEKTGAPIPAPLLRAVSLPVRFSGMIEPADMRALVIEQSAH